MTANYQKKNLFKSFLAGSVSGGCSCILFQPLDLVKTRLQTPLVACNSSNTGMIEVFVTVVRNEKLSGLWKGVTPSLSRTVPGVGVYFATLSALQSFRDNPTPLQSLCMGATARSVAVMQTLPITVIKTRYESGRYGYRSILHALTDIWRTEGARGLYSGLAATIIRDAPFSGMYLMFFIQTKASFNRAIKDAVSPAAITFSSGVVAGVLASLLTHPADVVKTKLQIEPKSYRRTMPAVLTIYKDQGFLGFFKGLAPRLIRRTLMAAMAWTVYEQVLRATQIKQ